ncbi:MAG TPA: GspH/FimT family pseudopilin [Gammaproteobacteria bacterium]
MPTYSAGSSGALRGYTLLELLVVLAIMAGLLTLAPPLFSSAASSTELHAATRQMSAALRQARSHAVATRTPVAFILDLERQRYQVEGRSEVSLPAKLELTLITAESELRGNGRGAIRFYADGSSSGGSITLSIPRAADTIEVAWLSGRVVVSAVDTP